MYDIKYKNLRKGSGFGSIFLIVGLLFFFIIGYITFGGIIKKASMDTEVYAIEIDENCNRDSDGDYTCSPIYYYKVGKEIYQCKAGYSSSSKVSNNQNKVYYNSENPENCVTDYTAKPKFYMYLLCLFPLIFVFIGANHIIKINKKIKKIKHLANYGTLIKNLPYTMEATGMQVNGHTIMAPAVDYTLASGTVLHLVGDPRYDKIHADSDGYVDLLIDLNDPNNYYIDFNISYK